MSKRKRLWLLGIALLLIAVFSLNALAYRQAYAMMHFTAGAERTKNAESLGFLQKVQTLVCGVSIPRPHSTALPGEVGSACRPLTITCNNSIKLGAWYCPAQGDKSLIILFHGYTADKSTLIREAKAFSDMGYPVMLVDFRGSGESSESYTTLGYLEGEDVAAAVQYAREKLGHKKVILYGQSMGSAAILRSIHDCGVQPDGIIIEAVFDNMLSTVRNRFRLMGVPSFPAAELLVFWGGRQFGFSAFAHNPAIYAAKVKCPALFLHGTADSRARIDEARRVYAAVPGLKQFEEFPGLAHEPASQRFPDQWRRSVTQFLAELQTASPRN